MLLEEALAGPGSGPNSISGTPSRTPGTPVGTTSSNASSTSSSSSSLPPPDAALALLSFLRDELPAGGIAAEKRFVNLFPLIVDRAFGNLVGVSNNASGVAVVSGGGVIGGVSSPSSSSISSPSVGSTSTGTSRSGSGGGGGAIIALPLSFLEKGNYRHADGGWLSLRDVPRSSSMSSSGPSSSSSTRSSTHSTMTAQRPSSSSSSSSLAVPTSLDYDPITRLLRAPRPGAPPTLLHAMSAESVHRPNIRFKFPLGGLTPNLVEDWRVCFLGDGGWNSSGSSGGASGTTSSMGTGVVGGGGSAAFGGMGGSFPGRAFGHFHDNHQAMAGGTGNTVKIGLDGKENATRILCNLLGASPMEQFEIKVYFQHLQQQRQQQQQIQYSSGGQQSHHFGNVSSGGVGGMMGSPYSKSGASSSYGAASPLSSPVPRGSPLPSKQQYAPMAMNSMRNINLNDPHLELSMVEYYLLVFVRFPLAHPALYGDTYSGSRTTSSGVRYPQRANAPPYGHRVYSYLLSTYLTHYLPHGLEYTSEYASAIANSLNNENGMGGNDATSPVVQAPTKEVGITCFDNCRSLDCISELFLRLMIELWLEGYNVAPTTAEALSRYRRARGGGSRMGDSSTTNDAIAAPSLQDSWELAQPVRGQFKPAPSQIQFRINDLVRHLVSDRSMRIMVNSASGACQNEWNDRRNGADSGVGTVGGGMTSDDDNGTAVGPTRIPWCLTPPMTAAQPAIFNYIRLALACGPVHGVNSIFHRAMETWLIYLEPWNYIMKKRILPSGSSRNNGGRGPASPTNRAGEFLRNAAASVATSQRSEIYPCYVAPKPTSASTYTAQWEAYVVSNLHLYTVPLAIFLKRARELDFSSSVEYPRSLALVQRVLRIYIKPLVDVLNRVLNKNSDAVTNSLVARHEENLGDFCPPTGWNMSSCQMDATNLLEEIFTQHRKRMNEMDFIDRWGAKVDNLFSGKYVLNEEAALQKLVSQMKYLVDLPPDYRVLPEEPPKSRLFQILKFFGKKDSLGQPNAEEDGWSITPDRGPDGKITDLGRRQMLIGLRKCDPLDVHFLGDPMLARVKSYEVPVLVDLTIALSNYLNRKLGLVPDGGVPIAEAGKAFDVQQKLLWEMERYNRIRFRINLRFLADPRNVVFLSFILWFVRSIAS